jgi:conjugal transfer/type IV secretion protein DotA/TraY
VQQNQNRLEDLGFTGAGAYCLEIGRMAGTTLSLLSATPVINAPSYAGLGQSLASDIAPLQAAVLSWTDRIMSYAQTTDGLDVAGGNADLFSGATPGEDGAAAIEQLSRKMHLSERVLNAFLSAVAPTGQKWQDPFVALIDLGQKMILIALSALGAAGLLASTTGTAASTAFNLMTLNFTGAAASVVGHMLVNFLAGPIFYGCMALLVPGLIIAFVLPMVPFAFWIGGVAGWFILVCEAVVAFPMWAFAHLTLQGDGLHGRGIKGYELLCNLLFRPVLMLFGLFLGYVIFAAISWLLMQSFGIAAGFVLSNGWLVTNLLGVIVLLFMFVLMEVVVAVLSFRMISLVPHHAIGLMAIQPANRVDMDRFAQDVGLVGLSGAVRQIGELGAKAVTRATAGEPQAIPGGSRAALPAPSSHGAVDSALNAATDVIPPAIEEE